MMQDDDDPRRSGRERQSTLTWIDGHAVKRENNYTVTGMEYIRGSEGQSEDPSLLRRRESAKKRLKTDGEDQPLKQAAAVKQPSQQQVLRGQHNDRIKALTATQDSLRASFLAQHVDLLQGFCEPQVLDHLAQAAKVDYTPISVVQAPQAIQATLRGYQLDGLTFMANMHRQNLPMILGDEMGLVRTGTKLTLNNALAARTCTHILSLRVCFYLPGNDALLSTQPTTDYLLLLLLLLI
jgi:SNF2 family DNA or RNA helicase